MFPTVIFFFALKNLSYIALILSVILWFKLTISWTKEAHHTKSRSVQRVRGTKNTIANPAHAISVSGVKVNHIKTSETTDHYIVPLRKDNEQHPNTRVLCETSEASLYKVLWTLSGSSVWFLFRGQFTHI